MIRTKDEIKNAIEDDALWDELVAFVAAWMRAWYQRPDLEFRMPNDWLEDMS
jgi:hypothetical protein